RRAGSTAIWAVRTRGVRTLTASVRSARCGVLSLDAHADPRRGREDDADGEHQETAAQDDVVEVDFGAADVVALALVIDRPQDGVGHAGVREIPTRTSLGDDALILGELGTADQHVPGAEDEKRNAGDEEAALIVPPPMHGARLTSACTAVKPTVNFAD